MAAISLSDCTVRWNQEGEVAVAYVVTPTSADSADTVDVTAITQGRSVINVSGWDVTTGDSVTATYAVSTDVITIDAAGGTTDKRYVVKIDLLKI